MSEIATTSSAPHVFQRTSRSLSVILGVLFALSALPFLALSGLSLSGLDTDLWSHLSRTVLWPAISETLILMTGVGVLVTVIGVATAWLVTMCRFPGRNLFVVALLLPLALPTYVSAFAYIEFLGFTGPLQSAIRSLFGFTSIRDYWFPDYRSIGGAMVVMSLVLYPYVYLTSRATFVMQTASVFDASRILGATPFHVFWRVGLPMARPAIIIGVSLALMETANDIGAVEFFGVRTLTTTIYDVWLNRSSLGTAAQIATLFLLVIVGLLWLERHARKQQRLFQSTSKNIGAKPFILKGWRAFSASLTCALPVMFGFLIPVLMMSESALSYAFDGGLAALLKPVGNSLFLASMAMVVTLAVGLFFAYVTHIIPTPLSTFAIRLTTLGYAIPGIILAVGLLIPLAYFDNALDAFMVSTFDVKTGLLLSGSTFALIYAYSIRFLPIAFGSCDTGFQRMSPNFGHAARALGRTELGTIKAIYIPLLRPALLSSGLLVFVDCMKELPATLLMRPFNFDTLATRVYDSASLEVFEEGALPALAIVLVGLLPVILLSLQTQRQQQKA